MPELAAKDSSLAISANKDQPTPPGGRLMALVYKRAMTHT